MRKDAKQSNVKRIHVNTDIWFSPGHVSAAGERCLDCVVERGWSWRCGQTALCVFSVLFAVDITGSSRFWRFASRGNVICKCGRWVLALVHHLNGLETLFSSSFSSSSPHCTPSCAVRFTEMWDTGEVDTWQTAASSCFISHYCNLSFTPFWIGYAEKTF